MVALSHLQHTKAPTSAKEIAETYELSNPMLANVMKTLTGAGYLSSTRGASGGYQLKLHPARISVGDILDLIDGPQAFSDCSDGTKDCQSASKCPAKKSILMIHKKIKGFVNDVTLADLAAGDPLPNLNLQFKPY